MHVEGPSPGRSLCAGKAGKGPLKSGLWNRGGQKGGPSSRGEPGTKLHSISKPTARLSEWPMPRSPDPGGVREGEVRLGFQRRPEAATLGEEAKAPG